MCRVTQLAFIITAALCSACSPNLVNSAGTTTAATTTKSSLPGTISTTPSPTPSATSTASAPLITQLVIGSGYSAESVTVSAGSVLKMTFTPGTEGSMYSQLGVYLTVNGMIQNTGMLYNALATASQIPETSPILNFSSALSSSCIGSEGCRESVAIVIDHPNDDYYCLNLGEYCNWTQVPTGQPWQGTLTIQTDDTIAL